MELLIRSATSDDISAILELYRQPELDNGQSLNLTQAANIFTRIQTYPNYMIYVAVIGSNVVGTFALLIMDNLIHFGQPSGVIEAVAVAPAWQRQGIGRELMQFAIQQCRQQGCYKVALSSELSRRRTHAFYEAIGFQKHGYSYGMELE
jgi:ribosomal protein S18 acetylase RimI-like enzyme